MIRSAVAKRHIRCRRRIRLGASMKKMPVRHKGLVSQYIGVHYTEPQLTVLSCRNQDGIACGGREERTSEGKRVSYMIIQFLSNKRGWTFGFLPFIHIAFHASSHPKLQPPTRRQRMVRPGRAERARIDLGVTVAPLLW